MTFNSNVILEQLDRGLVKSSWMDLFPYLVERHLIVGKSDHLPLLFSNASIQTNGGLGPPLFRFEN